MPSLPPLASVADLQARLGVDLSDPADAARAGAALDDASAIVRRVTRHTWMTVDETSGDLVVDAPSEVVAITLRLAVTAFTNPDGIRQESIGSYSYSLAGAGEALSAGWYLTPFEMRVLGAYRVGQTRTPLPPKEPGRWGWGWEESGIINLAEPAT